MASTCCSVKCKDWARRKINSIFFNSLLKVIDGLFLVILMTAAINIKQVKEGKLSKNSASYSLSIFALVVVFLELICVAVFLKLFQASLKEDKRVKRCGYIYEGLNYAIQGGMALTYPLLCQLRLVILVYTTLYLKEFMVI